MPCKPCETTVWQQILPIALCPSPQLLLLVTGNAFRIFVDSNALTRRTRLSPLMQTAWYMLRRNGGPRHGRRDGTKGSRVMWEPGHKRPNTQRPSKQKRTRQRESKVLLLPLLLLRPKLTCTLQKKERVQAKCRSSLEVWSGWLSMYEDQTPALVRIVIEEAWSTIFSILTVLKSQHLFGYVHLRLISHTYHGQKQQSRSSRRSSGRARTGSDPTTIERKSTPASEFGLLQQSPGRLEMLSPFAETVSQVDPSLRPTIVQAPRGSKTVFSTPRGGPESTRSSGDMRGTPSRLLDHPSSLVLLTKSA